jgi:predicted Zn finger-like uncharacterized protein
VSLATRCSACGTVFRVVQDQLRVSSGWVRCGRCGEVFNAVESLVDLELDRLSEDAAPSAHGSRVMHELAQVAGDRPPPLDAGVALPGLSPLAAPATPGLPPAAPLPEAQEAQEAHDAAVADEEVVLGVDGDGDAAVPPDSRTGALPSVPPNALPEPDPFAPTVETKADMVSMPLPSFVRSAERAARWRRPWVRAGLALLVVVAIGALGWQLAVTQHDAIAARWPALQPWLEGVCAQAGCALGPPMRIDALSVESSGLLRAGPPGTYRLQLVLRNRESMALRIPHVDLSLTDALGQTLARRVLTPAQMGAPRDRIDGGAELPLATTLRTQDGRVVGYTIEVFYP